MKKRLVSLLVVMCMLAAFAPWVRAVTIVDSGSCGDNLIWTLDSNGILTISGEGNMRNFDISQRYGVPSWYEHRLEIISVVVNAGVTSIGREAFFQCSNITNVKLPVGIVSIGNQAFGSCDKLQSINIPNTVTDIESWAFSWCENLKNINIPEGIQEISYEAFAHCNSLEVVNIPNNTETICSGAFSYCDSLSTVNIGTGLATIETDAFTDSKGNLYFNVDSGNQSYCDIDGVLYNRNKTSIISYAKDVAVPNYSISEGVTSIDSEAFHTCFQLKSIRIPNSVTKIDNAFGYCNNLTDVYYEGTEQQWKKIDISNDYDNNTPLLNATIHFLDDTIMPTPTATPEPTPVPTLEPIDNYDVSILKASVISSGYATRHLDIEASLSCDIPQNGSAKLIAAAYDGDRLIDISVSDIFSDDYSVQFSVYGEHVDCIKLFAWKGLNDTRPLCDAVTIDEADFITE